MMRAKTFQARVDQATTKELIAIQRAEDWTDSQLIKHALELVIEEADQNLASLADKADAMRDFLTGKTQDPPEQRVRNDDEVGPGGKTFQGRIKGPDVDRLRALARIEGCTESQLVRHGLKLVIEEASRDIDQIRDKLQAEYHAALQALNALSSRTKLPAPAPVRSVVSVGTSPSSPENSGAGPTAGRTPRKRK